MKRDSSFPGILRPGRRSRSRRRRRQGWAEDREENEAGVVCYGVPLLRDERPVAALSVTLPLVRLSPPREREIIGALKSVARRGLGPA